MKIVALTGPAGSGKDTAADFIAQWGAERHIHVYKNSFATRLKESAVKALGAPEGMPLQTYIKIADRIKNTGTIEITVPLEDWEDGSAPESVTITGRQFHQFYGTEAHRGVFGDDFWLNVWQEDVDELNFAGDVDVLVVPDLRFPNEATQLKRMGAHIWLIDRPDAPGAGGHVSESGVDATAITLSVDNGGELSDFQEAINAACDSILG